MRDERNRESWSPQKQPRVHTTAGGGIGLNKQMRASNGGGEVVFVMACLEFLALNFCVDNVKTKESESKGSGRWESVNGAKSSMNPQEDMP